MPFFKLFRHIIETEGWKRLYRGLASALSGAGLSWALYFAWSDWFKRALTARKLRQGLKNKLTALEEMLCAAAAGILTTLIVNPIWVINTRLKLAAHKRTALRNGKAMTAAEQRVEEEEDTKRENAGQAVKAVKEKNTVSAIIALIRREGLLGWLSGIIPALILLINPAIQLSVYGTLRKWIAKQRGGAGPGAMDAFVMGAASKFFAVLLTFPAQTIKLRMQAGLKGDKGSLWREIVTAGTLDERLSKILSLWTGVGQKMMTSMLHAAVMFSVVEVFRALNKVVGRKYLNYK